MSRRLIRSAMPDLEPPTGVVALEDVPRRLRSALLSAVDPDRAGYDEVALLSAGTVDSAFFEHQLLADRMGVPVVTPRDLQVTDDGVFLVGDGGRTRLSALYRRIDELELMESAGADLRPIGRALGNAVRRGNVALLNGFGNGVADDKLTYAYVPEMIHYYLDEKPILDNVPTYPCVDPERRAEVLDRLDELVLKPVNGYGGKGIVIGPHASQQERDEVAAAIRAEPAMWVAQDMVSLSTHPTFTEGPPGAARRRPAGVRAAVAPRLRHGRRRAPGRAHPRRPRGQHDRQLVPRRWRQGHLGPEVERGRRPVGHRPRLCNASVRGCRASPGTTAAATGRPRRSPRGCPRRRAPRPSPAAARCRRARPPTGSSPPRRTPWRP